MAKLTGPLLSFGASGQIGGAVVYSSWKGIPTARQFVTPANPNTPDQVAQRTIFSLIVALWRNPLVLAIIRTAWNALATAQTVAMSGFNVFTSNLAQLYAELPTASCASSAVSTSLEEIVIGMINIADGSTGTETGNFQIVYGNSPSNMIYSQNVAIVAGNLSFSANDDLPGAETVYLSIRKSGGGTAIYERAGIIAVDIP